MRIRAVNIEVGALVLQRAGLPAWSAGQGSAPAVDVILPVMDEDAAAIQGVLGGDIERYAELVDRYQAQTIRLAFSLIGNMEDAQDVAQDAFVSAYKSLKSFRGRAKFSTWLHRIVVNKCKDAYRRRAHAVEDPLVRVGSSHAVDEDAPGLFVDAVDESAGPDRRAADRELAAKISGAIGTLPEQQRTAFVLHHLHGRPLQDVAGIMGCRLGTVKAHVFRATERLREALDASLIEEIS